MKTKTKSTKTKKPKALPCPDTPCLSSTCRKADRSTGDEVERRTRSVILGLRLVADFAEQALETFRKTRGQ